MARSMKIQTLHARRVGRKHGSPQRIRNQMHDALLGLDLSGDAQENGRLREKRLLVENPSPEDDVHVSSHC
jgi:hypothetical protein